MSKVISIKSHPRFGNSEKTSTIEHDPIIGLDGDVIENEFMEESFEPKAVIKFMCDMGFIVEYSSSNFAVATFRNTPFASDWISIDVPPSFHTLSFACGLHAFKDKNLARNQRVLVGKLGVAVNQASFMWKQAYKAKAA